MEMEIENITLARCKYELCFNSISVPSKPKTEFHLCICTHQSFDDEDEEQKWWTNTVCVSSNFKNIVSSILRVKNRFEMLFVLFIR